MAATPLFFAPDLDLSWNVNPGVVSAMWGWAPLLDGSYGVIGMAYDSFGLLVSLTGNDHLTAKLYRQVNGSVRLLTFRKQNIDEYDNAGTLTNRGTSYSASTADWSSAAWGNQIIACNYLDATQSSTGAGFSALSGAPKARFVASNLDHVMFADVDDGGSNVFSDMVWWCDLQDPTSWTPTIGGEAGRIRVLEAPGPTTAFVAFQDMFIVFKANAMIVLRYTGSQFVFSKTLLSKSVGCLGAKAVVEMDNVLYFLHSSGFWAFDGQSLKNIGTPVNQTFLKEYGYLRTNTANFPDGPPSGFTTANPSTCQVAADDFYKIVWFSGSYYDSANTAQWLFLYGYNTISQKWGRFVIQSSASNVARGCFVLGSSADRSDFFSASVQVGVPLILNDGPAHGTRMYRFTYPAQPTFFKTVTGPQGTTGADFTTGLIGSEGPSQTITRVNVQTQHKNGSVFLQSGDNGYLKGYNTPYYGETPTTITGTINSERQFAYDFSGAGCSSKYKSFQLVTQTGAAIVSGLSLESVQGSR